MQTETVYYSVLCNYLGALPVKLMFFRIRENSLTASQENPAKLYDERCSTCALKFLYIQGFLKDRDYFQPGVPDRVGYHRQIQLTFHELLYQKPCGSGLEF